MSKDIEIKDYKSFDFLGKFDDTTVVKVDGHILTHERGPNCHNKAIIKAVVELSRRDDD